MKKGRALRLFFSASFFFVVALCALITTDGKDAIADDTAVTAYLDGSEFGISVGTLLLRREETGNQPLLTIGFVRSTTVSRRKGRACDRLVEGLIKKKVDYGR